MKCKNCRKDNGIAVCNKFIINYRESRKMVLDKIEGAIYFEIDRKKNVISKINNDRQN